MPTPRLAIIGQDTTHAPATTGPAVLQSGFRLFFLLAALLAALLVPAWLAVLSGALGLRPALDPLAWHGHAMIFGFAQAVIAGFLLTAASVWTGRVTARGWGLAALGLLWLSGRVLGLAGPAALGPAAVVSVAFPVALAAVLAVPIWRARSRRNFAFVPLLFTFAAAEVALYGEALGAWSGARAASQWVALDVVAIMISVVGGRIIPPFTRNATQAEVRERNALDVAAPLSVALLVPLHALSAPAPVVGGALALAGALNLLRMSGWRGLAAARQPFVLVLHLGYLGTALGLLLEGAAAFWPALGYAPGRHLLGVGGIALLCLGMMTRVALGHTGRPLHPPRGTTALYALLAVAAVVRVGASIWPSAGQGLLWISGLAFAASFVGYLALYARFLVAPRADGRPG